MASLLDHIKYVREKRKKKNPLGASEVNDYADEIEKDLSNYKSSNYEEGDELPSDQLKLEAVAPGEEIAPRDNPEMDVGSKLFGPRAGEDKKAARNAEVEANLKQDWRAPDNRGEDNPTADSEIPNEDSKDLDLSEGSAIKPIMGSPEQAADKQAHQELETAVEEGDTSVYPRSFHELKSAVNTIPDPVDRAKFEEQRQALQDKYESAKGTNEWGQVADLIGQGLLKMGAGLYGMKHGVDVSGIKFNTFDWEKRLDRLRTDLDKDTAQVNKQEDQDLDQYDKSIARNRQNIGDTQSEYLNFSNEGRAQAGEERADTKFQREEEAFDPASPKAEAYRGIIKKSDTKGKYPDQFLQLFGAAELKELNTAILKGDELSWIEKQAILFKNQEKATDHKNDRIDERQFRAGIKNTVKELENDTVVKKLKEQGLAFNQAKGLIDQAKAGNEIAMGALGAKMARAMGEVGVLTEEDVARYIKAQTVYASLSNTLKLKWIDGSSSDESFKQMKEVIGKMQTGFGRMHQDIQDRYINQAYENYGKDAGFTREETKVKFGGEIGGASQAASTKSTGIPAEGNIIIQKAGEQDMEIPATDFPDAKADGWKKKVK